MRERKYYLALDSCEQNVIIDSLNELRNKLISENRYTDAVDELIAEQIKKSQGITEQLKTENMLEWTGRLNNIRACAMKIVNKEIIFNYIQLYSIKKTVTGYKTQPPFS